MSPEQIRDARTVDARSDRWSLGITLFEMLTGKVPFDGHTTPGVLAQIAADAPADPRTIRAELVDVVLACLEKDRAKRPADIAQLAARLAPFASEEGQLSAKRIPKIAARARAAGDLTVLAPAPVASGGTTPPMVERTATLGSASAGSSAAASSVATTKDPPPLARSSSPPPVRRAPPRAAAPPPPVDDLGPRQ